MLFLRILTIIVCIACFACGVVLTIAGLLEKPADTDAGWIGAGVCTYFLADLYLLYRSYKKKHAPTHWVAFLLGILPALVILIIVWLVGKLEF